MTFQIGSNVVVNKFLGAFFMANSYQGRLHANITNSYTSITLLGVKRSEMGSFTLKISSQPNMVSTSTTVEISVLYQPEIVLHPLNATKVEGENITWSCNATGNPEPNISWIFYGSHINTTYNPRIAFSKGRQKMTITSIIRMDSGEYQCMATNMLGNVSSRVATLDVL
ncbi:unnamed protein product [Pocillopora meandrina]|uniref:Ig-like domain-containing protein n=1 Tax=Pocillopora meandrina TaxID=46732 RepID=A0AAU9Y030_9CNID|nr:unnamed protein product [Pocillopora meandrina]